MPATDTTEDKTLTKDQQEQQAHEDKINTDPGIEVATPLRLPGDDDVESNGKVDTEDATGTVDDKEGKASDAGDTAADTKEEFDAELLSIAAGMGIGETQARAYSSPGDLERTLLAMADRDEAAQPDTKAEKKPDEKKDEPKPIRIAGSDDLDGELVKQVNGALEQIEKRYEDRARAQAEQTGKLEASLTSITASLNASQAAQVATSFDNALVAHGAAYTKELGEGSTLSMTGASRANRDKVLSAMQIEVAGCRSLNQPIPGDDQLVQGALQKVFGAREKSNGAATKQERTSVRRGSSRASAGMSKQMRARLELREKLEALDSGE